MIVPERFETMSDNEFRKEIVDWIKTHYTTVLGKHINLLKQDNGLELLRDRVQMMMKEKGMLKDEKKYLKAA